jgi:hypothetical protein
MGDFTVGCQRLDDGQRAFGSGILILKGVTMRERLGSIGIMVSIPHNGVGGFLRMDLACFKTYLRTFCHQSPVMGACLATYAATHE